MNLCYQWTGNDSVGFSLALTWECTFTIQLFKSTLIEHHRYLKITNLTIIPWPRFDRKEYDGKDDRVTVFYLLIVVINIKVINVDIDFKRRWCIVTVFVRADCGPQSPRSPQGNPSYIWRHSENISGFHILIFWQRFLTQN